VHGLQRFDNFILLLCRLLTIAEETLAEFMSKATGTTVNWVQMVGMKVVYFFLICTIIM
jgi:hypothetical protein